MFEMLLIILGSLGLTFIGSRLVGANVQLITAGFLRSLMQKFMSVRTFMPFWGIIFGLLLQSTNTAIFMSAGLIASDIIGLTSAMLLSSWANVGSSLIIFNLIFNSNELAYILIAVAGFGSLFRMRGEWLHLRELLLGFGLVYLGLNIMIPTVQTLAEHDWVIHFFSDQSLFFRNALIFSLGILLAFVMQGPSIFLAFALGSAAVFSLAECMLFIFGSSIGLALSSMVITSQPGPLQSNALKLSIYRLFIAILGSSIAVSMLSLEVREGIPLFKALLERLSGDIQVQLMFLIVLYIFFATLLSTLLIKPLKRLIVLISPQIFREDLSKPKYIYKQAITDPMTAMDLLVKEEHRLMLIIGKYIEMCRNIHIDHIPRPSSSFSLMHDNFSKLSKAIENFQQELSIQNLSEKHAANFLHIVDLHTHILSLEESIYQFAYIIQHSDPQVMYKLIVILIESLDVIYLTAINALGTKDPHEIHLLIEITHDRKGFLDDIRDGYLNQEPALPIATKSSVLVLTGLTERIVWVFRRLGLLMTAEFSKEH